MNNYFEFSIFGYEIRAKHIKYLWFSERNEISCKVYLFLNIALIVRKK